MTPIPQIGDPAPSFELPAHDGSIAKIKGIRKYIVLYFYPRDDTPGCTTEACDFRDQLPQFAELNAVLLGISTDSVASHQKFAERYGLPFRLLSDEDHAVCEKYGVWVEKNMYGKKSMGVQRATFLIDKEGKIAAVWPKVKVSGHVDAVRAKLTELA